MRQVTESEFIDKLLKEKRDVHSHCREWRVTEFKVNGIGPLFGRITITDELTVPMTKTFELA